MPVFCHHAMRMCVMAILPLRMEGKVKIYTKTGDSGDTGLLGNVRVGKDAPRIEAYGTVDRNERGDRALSSRIFRRPLRKPAPGSPQIQSDLHDRRNSASHTPPSGSETKG